jgi:hypothetical protein
VRFVSSGSYHISRVARSWEETRGELMLELEVGAARWRRQWAAVELVAATCCKRSLRAATSRQKTQHSRLLLHLGRLLQRPCSALPSVTSAPLYRSVSWSLQGFGRPVPAACLSKTNPLAYAAEWEQHGRSEVEELARTLAARLPLQREVGRPHPAPTCASRCLQ